MQLPDSHRFARLSDGQCHYRVDGPEEGPVVLLVHGATVPEWEFDRLRPYLVEAGFRTISLDLFGHGYSDRPRLRYHPELFVRQAAELLDVLGVDRPIRIIGHSLGSAIAARLAVTQPHRVSALVLVAPLVDFTANLPGITVLRIPVLGEVLARAYVVPMLVRRRTRRYREIEDGRFVVRFRNQLVKPGFDRALLGLVRHGALGDQRPAYRALPATGHPVLLIWGEDDAILPPSQREVLMTLLPNARRRVIAGTAHSMLLTHPERVAPEVLEFFGRPDEGKPIQESACS